MPSGFIKKIENSEFILFSKNNSINQKPQITISKKVAQKATDRNRIRRIIKEALLKINQRNGNIKIIVKKNISNLKTGNILKLLNKND